MAPAERRAENAEDTELVAAVRAGDDRAFERLYGRYQRRIAAYIYGMVGDYGRAEDIAQEVFMSALRRMRETDRPLAFKPWIYEIAKNACIDQFRRSRRTEEISYDIDDGSGPEWGRLETGGPTPDMAVDQKVALDNLCGAFGGLSEAHHQILVMRELEGLSYREIGERMGLSRPSVESTLFRARRRLAEEYDELVTGARCQRIHRLIGRAADGTTLGARDGHRLARHISHCQPCRRHARLSGVDAVPAARLSRAGIAGLIPLPAFLRRGQGPSDTGAHLAGGNLPTVVQWSANLGTAFDPIVAGWAKAVAAAATIAVAGLGAGMAADGPSGVTGHHDGQARSIAPATPPKPSKVTARSIGEPASAPAATPRRPASGPASATTTGSSKAPTAGAPAGPAEPLDGPPDLSSLPPFPSGEEPPEGVPAEAWGPVRRPPHVPVGAHRPATPPSPEAALDGVVATVIAIAEGGGGDSGSAAGAGDSRN